MTKELKQLHNMKLHSKLEVHWQLFHFPQVTFTFQSENDKIDILLCRRIKINNVPIQFSQVQLNINMCHTLCFANINIREIASKLQEHLHVSSSKSFLCSLSFCQSSFLAVTWQLYRFPCHWLTHWLTHSLTATFEKHYQRSLWETCDPWDMWPEW